MPVVKEDSVSRLQFQKCQEGLWSSWVRGPFWTNAVLPWQRGQAREHLHSERMKEEKKTGRRDGKWDREEIPLDWVDGRGISEVTMLQPRPE